MPKHETRGARSFLINNARPSMAGRLLLCSKSDYGASVQLTDVVVVLQT